MWFLIKGTLYCSMGLVALSFLGAPPREEQVGGPTLEIGDAFAAATDAYDYVTSICIEKPDVCEKGKQTFQALGQRAREGALVAFQLLDQQFTDDGISGADVAEQRLPTMQGRVEIEKPAVDGPAVAATATRAEPIEALVTETIITGTVIPNDRPKNLPKPYTPPKP